MAEIQFLDSSALGRLVDAVSSAADVRAMIHGGGAVVCTLAIPESRSIINTKLRRGVDAAAAEEAWQLLLTAVEAVHVLDLDVDDHRAARDLLVGHRALSAADALHLVAARRAAAAGIGVTFVTADRLQAEVASELVDAVILLD
ncbi:MAG: hypothetical protein ACR2MY_04825 [Candidatus Dormibacteria bacterium]